MELSERVKEIVRRGFGEIDMTAHHTVGPAGESFRGILRDGELLSIAKCAGCYAPIAAAPGAKRPLCDECCGFDDGDDDGPGDGGDEE